MLIIQEQTFYQDTKLNHDQDTKLNHYQDTQLNHYSQNTRTDKNTVHSYLPLNETLLIKKKETFLEIGIQYGGSIKLWSKFCFNL